MEILNGENGCIRGEEAEKEGGDERGEGCRVGMRRGLGTDEDREQEKKGGGGRTEREEKE